MSKSDKGPYRKVRKRRFQVTLWRSKREFTGRNPFDVPREVENITACVQHSKFNFATKDWENVSIWCKPAELGDLIAALEELVAEERAGKPENGEQRDLHESTEAATAAGEAKVEVASDE